MNAARRGVALSIAFLFPLTATALAQGDAPSGYRKPPEAIRKVLELPRPPAAGLSAGGDFLVLAERAAYPSIEEVSRPFLRLAGLRIDPRSNGPRLPPRYTAFNFQPTGKGTPVRLKLPDGARPGVPLWSPDGRSFAMTNTTAEGVTLWLGAPASDTLRPIAGVLLNAASGESVRWLGDGKTLVVQTIPAGRGKPPAAPLTPAGPTIQESFGKAGPAPTYQDLLRNKHDEELFDYYCTSQLALIDSTGKVTGIGKPGVYSSCQPSPDGRYLLVERVHRPYSYVLPVQAFPKKVEVWDRAGKVIHTLADLPLADRVPIEGVPTGPRTYHWRPTDPATLVWVTALDEGNPRKKVDYRDSVWLRPAPFDKPARALTKTTHRYAGLIWGEKGVALLSDYERERRRRRTYLLNADKPEVAPRLVWDRSIHDQYGNPGIPLMRRIPGGRVLRRHGNDLFLAGAGASPKGSRPFLDRLNLETLKTARVFQSAADCYEAVVDLLSEDGSRFLTRHESPASPPNFRVREVGKASFTALTSFTDAAPILRKVTRKLVTYKRADGVPLSFTLYLPPDYKPGTRLPTILWAYPREYTDPSVAGQVAGTPMRYTLPVGPSHLFFLLAGYAVLDGATMPVVGAPEKANDTFVEQIVASAKAAIDKADELGVTDRNRVAVGGHSYGAFMTANLLAHSRLFRAGIARSGAYNRTLTPFGFQNERRTLWQAPEVYVKMSPLMHADKIKSPLLLIHGDTDNNSGTFPMQSERLYQAIRGNGGTVRYVSLPHESHGYAARESVEHTLYEMISWCDRHVKEQP